MKREADRGGSATDHGRGSTVLLGAFREVGGGEAFRGVGGGGGGFFGILRLFSRSFRSSEVERQFLSPRWRRVLCHRGLPCTINLGALDIHSP